ncbi:MAG: preprotein translocase subunit SecY, partial [Christensenellaceae bacterium]
MLETLRNAWKIADLRKKMLFTLLVLFIYRVGAHVPVPGVNTADLSSAMVNNGLLELMNLFNGGALESFTVFATGITPYITASIVIQLLTVAIPKLEQLSKEGEEGRKKINQYTRIVGIALAVLTSIGTTISMQAQYGILTNPSWYTYLFIAIIHAAGTAFTMWCGERITERGIGNGISLLIFINIVSTVPGMVRTIFLNMAAGTLSWLWLPVLILMVLVIIVAIIWMDLGERRIPVQYAKRVIGRRQYGGQSTYLPLKVNSTGVMPLIFASTILQFPTMLLMIWPNWGFTQWWNRVMSSTSPWYAIVMTLLIIGFAYFYSAISFNPVELSKNIQQQGGFIPGIRPGKPTSDYLQKIVNRVIL